MIALFRKIRRSLIGLASAKKYMVYAIEEIALVVIGILIALHLPSREATAEQAGINNWNEDRKLRNLEQSN